MPRKAACRRAAAFQLPRGVWSRGVIIPTLDPDPESDFQLFGDSLSGFGCNKKQNRDTYRGVMILGLDSDPESDCQPFGNCVSGFGSIKKQDRNTSSVEAVWRGIYPVMSHNLTPLQFQK